MIREQYQEFKKWLIENNKMSFVHSELRQFTEQREGVIGYSESDVIGWLFVVNKICLGSDLFQLIKNKDYKEIYKLKNHYRIKKRNKHLLKLLLLLSFEYLNGSFDEYIEYEATTTLSKVSNRNTLFMHKGNIACLKYKHPIEDVNAAIVTDLHAPIYVHANRCNKCNIIFIRKEEISRLRKSFPFLVANFCELSCDGYTPIDNGFLSDASLLMLCGYNVKRNGLTEYYRHILLKNIIFNGILSKAEIIQYLEHFINFNGVRENMLDAVYKWECDLNFVRNLDIQSHPIVSVTEIKAYSLKDK